MNNKINLTLVITSISLAACGVVRDTPKYQFSDGYYKSKLFNDKIGKVYVDNEDENILVYPLKKDSSTIKVDTSNSTVITFPANRSDNPFRNTYFRETSFDVDFLTMPFKYRPSVPELPRQFNTNLNGVVYLGYRTDAYFLKYKANPLARFTRETKHYGFSFGIFNGISGTAMNPSVTNSMIAVEYDGVVWSKGLAGIIGINNVNIGLAVGWDDLLDHNKKFWLYQRKPWVGFAFGLNLN